jgi:NAD(P)H-hydrate epimerase
VLATPHAGEAARVLGVSPREVESQRLASCAALAGRFGTVALKGFHTLVADGNETRVILEGGPELAVPGSGDALTGAIGAFMASGMSSVDAATLGAIVHGAAGSARSKGSSSGLLAREIAEGVRDALHKA